MSKNTSHKPYYFLVNMAIADAYGAGFEFKPQEFVDQNNNLTGYFHHGKDDIPLGHYTDDTQMTLALCNLILAADAFAPLNIAKHFIQAYQHDKRLGYASGFQQFLESCQNESDFLNNIKPNSTKNGAAMRAIPCGFHHNLSTALLYAKQQAVVTHNTPEGVASAQAISLLSHFHYHESHRLDNFLNSCNLDRDTPFTSQEKIELCTKQALKCLQSHIPQFKFHTKHTGRVPCDGIQTVNAVLTALSKHDNLADILQSSVSFGGDTDSVAALAVGLASLSPFYEQNLPEALFVNFESESEDGAYGADYLEYIGEEVLKILPYRR